MRTDEGVIIRVNQSAEGVILDRPYGGVRISNCLIKGLGAFCI